MNNKVVVDTFNTFKDNNFSVCRVNFRGVGKSDGEFDNGQGELADAAAALDWVERENFDNSQCWIAGFSFFGSLIAMQLLMRRPEINRSVAISPQPNVYDFSFLSPCPTWKLLFMEKDELVPYANVNELNKRLSSQKGISIDFQAVNDANHFFSKADIALSKVLNKYIKKRDCFILKIFTINPPVEGLLQPVV